MSENYNEVEKLEIRPFTKFCMSIGAVPSSYLAGLSIEEQLLWLCSYLENEVIPTVNNNGESVEELQELFTELQTYVTNYFTNLDVQDEIDDKLDAMALNGTLATIINQEIFGELNTSINTINNTTIPNIQSQIDTINNTTIPGLQSTLEGEINAHNRNALYIGNSYTTGYGSSDSKGIFELTKNMFNNAYMKTGDGIGWLDYTDHTDTFGDRLSAAISDTNIPNNEITDIIIVGAWGDTRALHETNNFSTYRSNLQNAVVSFVSTVNANFTNVKRISYVLAESRSQKDLSETYTTYFSDTFWLHAACANIMPKKGVEYLGWIGFNILLDSQYFSSDHIHPNNAGYKHLSTLFKTAYQGSFTYHPLNKLFSATACGITSGSTVTGFASITPDNTTLVIRTITLAAGSTPSHGSESYLIDFNNLNFTIPLPAGTSNFELGYGFKCTTKRPQDGDFDESLNYKARMGMIRTPDHLNSNKIYLVTYGGSKTVSQQISSLYEPITITYSNSYYVS